MKTLKNLIKVSNKGLLYTHTHTHLISEKPNVIANKVKQSGEIATPYGLAMTGQYGRSMVEMLGVLAVIGILSVVGIAGFKNAMDKNKANTIINEAQKRATLIVPQIQLQNNANPTLNEFNNNLGYGIFDTTVYTSSNSSMPQGQFGIKVSGVSKEICQNILNTLGDNTIIRRLSTTDAPTTALTTCGETNTFLMVYNNDMSTNHVAGEFSDKSSCTNAGFIYNNGKCANDMCATCTTGQDCLTVSGKSKCVSACPSGQTRDDETGTCANNKCTDYTNCDEGYFCNFGQYSTSGTCKSISDITVVHSREVVINNKKYIGIESQYGLLRSYYQAEDWCRAQSGILPTYEYVGEINAQSYHECSGSGSTMAKELFVLISPTGRWIWASHPSNNRNNTFSFLLIDSNGNSMCAYENDYKTDRSGVCLLLK